MSSTERDAMNYDLFYHHWSKKRGQVLLLHMQDMPLAKILRQIEQDVLYKSERSFAIREHNPDLLAKVIELRKRKSHELENETV